VDQKILYEIACKLKEQKLDDIVCNHFHLQTAPCDMSEWNSMIASIKKATEVVKVTIVGKYVALQDAYISIVESLKHAGYAYGRKVDINYLNAEDLNEENYQEILSGSQGILVPGGFGERGIEGMILAARYARLNNIPYFGICLGMQIALVEFARNVCGMGGANSTEFNSETKYPIIDYLPEQYKGIEMGGTLRLGSYECRLKAGTKTQNVYQADLISERHRHRYEFNNRFYDALEKAGVVFSGINPQTGLVELMELKDHPWFVGCQFHPEFKSRPNRAHPLFKGFIRSIIEKK
jgi:CTP synthase